jgi:hypothetical protein
MLVAILTEEQKDLIQGLEMRPNNICNCVQDNNNSWVIDETSIALLNIEWLNNLPLTTFQRKEISI